MLEVRFEQEPLRRRVIRKAADESSIEGFFRLFSCEPARCFPPSLQISPGQPFGADLSIVDKNIFSTTNHLHVVVDCIAETQIRFLLRREDEVFRCCPDTSSDRYGCKNGVAASCAGLLKFDLAWLECPIQDLCEFVLLFHIRPHL